MVGLNSIWRDFLAIVREEAGSRVVETWFKAVVFSRWDPYEKIVYLKTPNLFVREWLSTHYSDVCKQHLGRLLHEKTITIAFTYDDAQNPQHPQHPLQPIREPAVVSDIRVQVPNPIVSRSAGRQRGPINHVYQFDTFVVGPNNSLAYAAAHAVAEKSGTLYNPLFIYGGSGLGKTHLLHAIGNHIKNKNKKAHILYQSADRFVNEFINAIRFDKIYQFETRYKDIDVLLIDDIQFISNKEQTQEAFFHIFNALHQAHKQIVCSSDSLPRDIAGLAERMRSRLEGGLIVDIQMASLETKVAILKKRLSLIMNT